MFFDIIQIIRYFAVAECSSGLSVRRIALAQINEAGLFISVSFAVAEILFHIAIDVYTCIYA